MKDKKTFEKRLKPCLEKAQNEFSRYDQSVDVVSCWQTYFETSEYKALGSYFDRFPKSPNDGKQGLTPDFTVLIGNNNDYGLIFDLKTGITRDNLESYIEKQLLPQLKKYDGIT